MQQDLVKALENAVERGSSIEEAEQSLINAGYPRDMVEEASHYVHSGVLPIMKKTEIPEQDMKIKGLTPPSPSNSKKPGNLKIIILAIVLILLLGLLISIIFFKDYFLDLLKNFKTWIQSLF